MSGKRHKVPLFTEQNTDVIQSKGALGPVKLSGNLSLIEVDGDVLSENIRAIINTISVVISEADMAAGSFETDQVKIKLAVGAGGEVGLLGFGKTSGNMQASLELVLKRRNV